MTTTDASTAKEVDYRPPALSALARLNDGLVDGAVIFFTGWSLASHVTVLLGGSLIQLLVASVLVIPAFAAVVVLAGRMSSSSLDPLARKKSRLLIELTTPRGI